MHRFTAKSRVAFGLVSILASILLASRTIGIQEDPHRIALSARAELTEVVAVNCCILATRGELDAIEQMLTWVVRDNSQLLAASLVSATDNVSIVVGVEEEATEPVNANLTSKAFDEVKAPVFRGSESWGSLVLNFSTLPSGSQIAWWDRPQNRNFAFICASAFVFFFVYLGAVLKYLDPSKAVPDRVRSALDTLAEGLMVLDARGQIVLVNQAFARLLGSTPEKLMGVLAKRLPWNAQDEHAEGFPWEIAIRDGRPREADTISIEISRGEMKGQQRILLVNSSPVSSGNSGACGVFVSFEDITQLEATKVELMHAKEAAEAASSAKSSFLANMSHEIRTPMNAILGFTDVLRRGLEPNEEKRMHHLETIHRSGTHLLNLINDILDLSKVEAGRFEVESLACDPHDILADVVNVLQSRAGEKGLTLLYESEGNVPAEIYTDPGRLRQILTNLIGNAIKFTSEGHVRITASLSGTAERTRFQLRVADTGVGMNEAALKKIFDPFSQADNSITRRFGGTGLGLAISRKFARALGGDITVRSQEGLGSEFTVTIHPGDVHNVRRVNWKDLTPSRDGRSSSKVHVASRLQGRVLIVEDGVENRELITLVLQQSGLEVATATNGKEGVDRACSETFDLIMMDMQMPVMDGYTAARILRQRGFSLPIVALTAHAMKGDEQKCLEAGCSDFLTKPINIDLLLQKISDILHRSGQSSQAVSSSQHVPSSRTAATSTSGELVEDAADSAAVSSKQVGLSTSETRLRSKLPLHHPQFRAIVAKFVIRLDQQLHQMEQALAAGDYRELASLGHWLKGTGGTVGFSEFSAPSLRLEQAATARQHDQCTSLLLELRQLAQSIDLAEECDTTTVKQPSRGESKLIGV